MNAHHPPRWTYPNITRRTALQAGAVSILGLGMSHLEALPAIAGPEVQSPAKSVIYIFLSGGLSQLDSFDLKPHAPPEIRGEFSPIATKTPGIHLRQQSSPTGVPYAKLVVENISVLFDRIRSLSRTQTHKAILSDRRPQHAGNTRSKGNRQISRLS